jgi:uncharacterized membrane protein YccC
MIDLLHPSQEPVVYTTLVGAVLGLAVAFGAPITPEQKAAVELVLGSVLALFIRSKVSPVAAG